MASQSSVRSAATEIRARFPRVDLLVNNAGVMEVPYQRTEDGFELTLATGLSPGRCPRRWRLPVLAVVTVAAALVTTVGLASLPFGVPPGPMLYFSALGRNGSP
jgi:NAD(P)-dependent dehydrogenase (short-subunit alcohol dehydrogenase family)